ncbi:hypothetical protein BC831DRAFT_262213, partial [Entophlyctis helioformis]
SLWTALAAFVAGIEDDLADFPNAWKVLSAIFVPLIESSLLSLATFIRIINGTNGYQSVIPVGPVAAFDTLDKLDPKLFVQLLVAEQTDLRSIWPADNNSDAAIAKFQSRRKQPTVDALSFVVTAVRNETAVRNHDALYRWINDQDDADLVASPAFVPATARPSRPSSTPASSLTRTARLVPTLQSCTPRSRTVLQSSQGS